MKTQGNKDENQGKINAKEIRITCETKQCVPLNDLIPFQGDLKTLDKANYIKLRNSLVKYGITFPFFVWNTGERYYVLDGHQRDRALRRMRAEGYKIPTDVPVIFIEAADMKEAKEKILLLSSQYGKMDQESLYYFSQEAALDMIDMKQFLELPKIDLDKFEEGWLRDFDPAEERKPEEIKSQFNILVICASEEQQGEILIELQAKGIECRALIS